MARPAVFIDRDGTLIEDVDFLTSADQIRILPNTIPALVRLSAAGYAVVVLTNQSAVARGLMTEDELQAIHDRLAEQVEMLGGRLDGIFYCPHLPEGSVAEYAVECECRKPGPGLFLRARDELDLELDESFAVGDAWRDVEAALAVGVPTVKLPRPAGRQERPRPDLPVLAEAADLGRAADVILGTTPEEARQKIREARARPASSEPPPRVTAKPKPRPEKPRETVIPEPEPDEEVTVSTVKESAPDNESEVATDVEAPQARSPRDEEPEFDASLAASPELESAGRRPQRADAELEYEPLDKSDEDEEPDDEEEEENEEDEDDADDEEDEDEEDEDEEDAEVEEEPEDEEDLLDENQLEQDELEPDEDDGEPEDEEEVGVEEEELEPEGFSERLATCDRCGAVIEAADLTTGKAGRVNDSLLCRACHPDVARMAGRGGRPTGRTPAAGADDVRVMLGEILGELRSLSRRQAQPPDSFDLPRVLALVAQALAVFLAVGVPLLRGIWEEVGVWLLAAILAQLLALTLFMISRRRD